MAVSDAFALQQAVFSAVDAVMVGQKVPVFDHQPTEPPQEFVRLDGMSVADESSKDTERGRHSMIIGFWMRPVKGVASQRGLRRVHEICAIIHDAVKDLRHGRGRMQFEFKDVDTDDDGASAYGTLRYTIII